jgi:16S rRNA G966 N2-methylase RsmD
MSLEKNTNSYDIIFADPPYALDQKTFENIVTLVFQQELLREDGMMVIEHSKYTKLDHIIHFSFKKSYGGSIFSFFEIIGNADEEVKVDMEATEED